MLPVGSNGAAATTQSGCDSIVSATGHPVSEEQTEVLLEARPGSTVDYRRQGVSPWR